MMHSNGLSADHLWNKMNNLVQYSRMRGTNLDTTVRARNSAQARHMVRQEMANRGEGGLRHLLPIMLDTLDLIDQATA